MSSCFYKAVTHSLISPFIKHFNCSSVKFLSRPVLVRSMSFLPSSGIVLHHALVQDPEIVFDAVKPPHTGVRRCIVRGWGQSLESAGSRVTGKIIYFWFCFSSIWLKLVLNACFPTMSDTNSVYSFSSYTWGRGAISFGCTFSGSLSWRHSYCCTWCLTQKVTEIVVPKKELQQEVRTLAPFSSRHSWKITAWSGCKCWFVCF